MAAYALAAAVHPRPRAGGLVALERAVGAALVRSGEQVERWQVGPCAGFVGGAGGPLVQARLVVAGKGMHRRGGPAQIVWDADGALRWVGC